MSFSFATTPSRACARQIREHASACGRSIMLEVGRRNVFRIPPIRHNGPAQYSSFPGAPTNVHRVIEVCDRLVHRSGTEIRRIGWSLRGSAEQWSSCNAPACTGNPNVTCKGYTGRCLGAHLYLGDSRCCYENYSICAQMSASRLGHCFFHGTRPWGLLSV